LKDEKTRGFPKVESQTLINHETTTPMNTNIPEKREPTFQEQLRARAAEWWAKYEESRAANTLVAFDWPQLLYEFVKEATLISFKNGVTVGQRKAGRPLDGSRQSAKVRA
jgi:hypothetical protein